MTRYVAFLRAINVPGHTVKMDVLRGMFESWGLLNVTTYIQSGNVIFESKDKDAAGLEEMLQQRLEMALGYPVATFVRTIHEVSALVETRPFPQAEFDKGANLYVAFLHAPLTPDQLEILESLRNPVDDFYTQDKALFWLRRKQLGESLYPGSVFEKRLGIETTIRNENTVRKIAEKYR